jgi:hypothetical protein
MKFKYKNLLVPAMITVLSACGSEDTSNTIPKGDNLAPVLAEAELETQYSATSTNDAGELEWEFTFNESDGNWDDPTSNRKVDYLDLDLLQGITDPNFGDVLIVKDVTFMWQGPNCSQTTTTALEYPEICNPILEELGLMEDDGEGGRRPINTVFEDEEDIRELQNLPVVSTPLYGFELKQDYIRVTPSLFAPILTTGQTAELGVIYKVSDGENEISRRISITVNGQDSAPQFVELDEFGEPVLDDDGNYTAVDVTSASTSEKGNVVVVNLLEGIFDQDVYDANQRQSEVGDLAAIYNLGVRSDFTTEMMSVHSFTPPAGVLDGTWSVIPEFREGVGIVSYNLILDPSTYADILAKGDEQLLTFGYTVSDGNNDVERTFDFTIKGANEFNEPSFDEANVTKVVLTNDTPQVVSLLEGVSDPEGDKMTLVDLVATGTDEYGITTTELAETGRILLDPYFFTYLKQDEVKDFTYTYKVSDGSLVSEERVYTLRITGANANLANRGENSDPGFEKSLADGPYTWQWSPSGVDFLTVDETAAHSGATGANSAENSMFIRINKPAFQQGAILEGDSFYFNFFAKQEAAWGSVNAIFNEEGVWNNVAFEKSTGNLGSNDWVEHTVTMIDAPEFFTEQATFDVTLISQKGFIDDVSLVKYKYYQSHRLVPESSFNLPVTGGWQVSGDATLEVLEEANRNQGTVDVQYGLKVTGGTEVTELYLDSSVLPQGAVKKGMRYMVSFDLKDEGFVSGSPAALNVMFKEEGGTNISRRLTFAEQTTAWEHYDLHITTDSNGNDFRGPVNTNVNFDWESVATRFAIQIPAGKTFHIDNIHVHPVPQ